MANKHTRRISTLLVITEIQIKTTMKYHYIRTRWLNLKRLTISNVDEHVEKLAFVPFAGGKIVW